MKAFVAGAVLMLVQGPGVLPSGADLAGTTVAPHLTYGVGVSRCTFVDHSRGVANFQTSPPSWLSRSRTLVTEIRYPIAFRPGQAVETVGAAPVGQKNGYPMIVFAHGYDATPDTYAPLLDAWAGSGFVVAAPFFPAESTVAVAFQHHVNTEDDLWNEPADLVFVTRQLVRSSLGRSSSCRVVRGLIRPSKLALAGHSDGATVVAMLAFAHGNDPQGQSYERLRRGLHFRAAVILSGKEDGVDAYGPPLANPALFVVQSAADQCNPIANALRLYGAIHQPDKWLLELRQGHHLPPFDGGDVPAFKVVTATTIRFFRLTLVGRVTSADLVASGNDQPTLARMVRGNVSPPIFPSSKVSPNCGPT